MLRLPLLVIHLVLNIETKLRENGREKTLKKLREILDNSKVLSYQFESNDIDGEIIIGGSCAIKAPSGSLTVVYSNGMGWDHVSVSSKFKTPSWDDMCFAKDIFFNDEESVVQYHPPKSEYINIHDHVLHMWRNQNQEIDRPPLLMV